MIRIHEYFLTLILNDQFLTFQQMKKKLRSLFYKVIKERYISIE
jgi:hypothetical protein